jgi:hypothetical protein
MEVFTEVLEPFIGVAMPKPHTEHVHNFDIGFLVEKHSRRLLDYEQVVHLHQYYAFP